MIRWSEPALNDVQIIALYLKESDVEIAREIVKKIFDAGESLKQFPARARIGRIISTREFLIPNTPYILVFSDNPEIFILRVLHSRQEWPDDTKNSLRT